MQKIIVKQTKIIRKIDSVFFQVNYFSPLEGATVAVCRKLTQISRKTVTHLIKKYVQKHY
jgi:hypothetical protein